ncbi:uncharacterized protein CMC5_072710 [Chondromyces crocatus]|uniref:Sulfatase-modifying factor enzyme-like domain-containing protein n=2 Tax=Chondromyces crocatus TaxID=52 RepID=A0A0K1EQE8_CHOCO|nr:uncharacterized protein CMC5_072710 [Chondromyces crocatus]
MGGAGGSGGASTGGGGSGAGPVALHCFNGTKDGNETDVDCGGSCARCDDGLACSVPSDCASRRCQGGSCVPASCGNGVLDGDETDIDCGGGSATTGSNPACPPCTETRVCAVGADCASLSCINNRCMNPTCSDGVKNGQETDIDCGGTCGACDPGAACLVGGDCKEQVCVNDVCLVASCNDGVKNGFETDIDCGNICGKKCPPGQRCSANGDCSTNRCQQFLCACPTDMVIAPVVGGGATCIDAYEVIQSEYNIFLQANPNIAGLPAICAGNIYQPSAGWPPADGRHPVTYVDWCDAYAYCKYAGKHLCGKIGGGSNPPSAYADATQSEWFNACTGQGVNAYPYGNTYLPNQCVGADSALAGQLQLKRIPPAPLPPAPTCIGNAVGLQQMSGNAAEWEDSCNASGQCRVRGGSSLSGAAALRCDASEFRDALDNSDGLVGFRCCL